MTKRFLIFIQIIILSLLLVACGGGSDPCDECKDADGDGFCDVCDEAMPDDGGEEDPPHTTCVDESPKDAKCDVCGKDVPCTTCVDESPKDAKCDVCGKDVPCVTHTNANEDGKCDVCGKDIPTCAECVDTNENERCDVCGSAVEPAEKHLCLIKDGVTNYTFVLSADLDMTTRNYISDNIIKKLKNDYGVQISATTVGTPNEKYSDYEIIVGNVENHGEEYYYPYHVYGPEGYVIKIVGNKVVINGGSGDAIYTAVTKFATEVIGIGAESITNVGITSQNEVEVIQTEFDVTSLKFGGTVITGGKIATDITRKEFLRSAEKIRDELYMLSGLWFEIVDLSDESAVIVIKEIDKVYSDESFTIKAVGGRLIISCAFYNALTERIDDFVGNFITDKTGELSFAGDVVKKDISFVTYEEFGAKGDGETNDFEYIRDAHNYANLCGQTVIGNKDATYYISETRGAIITIKTNVNWNGAKFIIDDRTINKTNRDVHLFEIASDTQRITASKEVREALAAAGLNPNTTKIDLEIFGVSGPVMIIPYNSTHKVYRRRGYSAWAGSSMHEVIVLDKDGNVSPDTPIMFDYTSVTTLYIYPLDESSAITVENATFTTRASQINRITSSGDTSGGYIYRGISINRSYTTLKSIEHYVTDEFSLLDQVDSNGTVIKCGAIYNGFFTATSANEVTLEDCVLTGRKCFDRGIGGADGTYDFSANLVNKIVLKNCKQSNFWVKLDDDMHVIPAEEGEDGAMLSMASVTVNGKSLKMCWGIGGTNYCKNMEYIGSTLSRLDAHAGLYNGKIIDSTVNYISLTGNGEFIVENTRWFASGTGSGSNAVFHLRNDYGSTWNGTITATNLQAYGYSTSKTYLVYHTYNNWYYGYTCVFPNLELDNLSFYDINTYEPYEEGKAVYLTGTSISATSKRHLPESHTNPYFPTVDADKDGKIDEPLFDRDLDGRIDGACDLDGDGVIGNTSLDYTSKSESGTKHTGTYVNLNIVRPPEFIKILNNEAGLVYLITNTSKNGISDGGYYDDIESYGGFFGDTKFYYTETDYLLGSNHDDQTVTSTFKFQ